MSIRAGQVGMGGRLGLTVVRSADKERVKQRIIRRWRIRQFFAHRWREIPLWFALALRRFVPGLTVMVGAVYLRYTDADGEVWDYGLAGRHLVTTAGKNFVAACFDNTNEPETLKYHGFGTGTNAAAIGDTALQTELTTQYATDNVRPTGTQAHSTNTYTTVGTVTPDSAVALTEWGLLSQAATGGGTLFDRQVYSAINLNGTGDSLAATYVLSQT
jgi:hypothetical protein